MAKGGFKSSLAGSETIHLTTELITPHCLFAYLPESSLELVSHGKGVCVWRGIGEGREKLETGESRPWLKV
jgi:hypothetical protein